MALQSDQLTTLQLFSKEMLEDGFDLRATLNGFSMFPFLRGGDIATIEPCSATDLKVGDIAVYQANSRFVVHRVIRKKEENGITNIVCKGDSCLQRDSRIDPTGIIGRVRSYERGKKKVSFGSRSRQNFNYFLAIISPFLPPFYLIVRIIRKLVRKIS